MSGFKVLVLTILVGTLAMLSGQSVLYHLTDVLAATVVICFLWGFLSVRGLRLTRTIRADRASVGQVIEQRLELRASLPIPRIWLEVVDEGTVPGYHAGRVLDLGLGGRRVWNLDVYCPRRGVYQLGPTTIGGADPLGLFRFRRRIGGARTVLVYPETFDLTGLLLPAGQLLGGDQRKSGWHQTTPFIAGVRDYQPGDPVRHIHWRSTAHAGRLMVKEFDAEPVADVWIFLDLQSEAQRGEGDESTEEYGVKIAASLARHYISQGRGVGLVAVAGQRYVLQPDRGQRQLTKILEELAVIRANGTASIAAVLATESDRCSRDAALLVVTPSLDERWPGALRHHRERGIHAGAVVLEPGTFGEADNALLLIGTLASNGIPSILVKQGDDLGRALTEGARRVIRSSR